MNTYECENTLLLYRYAKKSSKLTRYTSFPAPAEPHIAAKYVLNLTLELLYQIYPCVLDVYVRIYGAAKCSFKLVPRYMRVSFHVY